MARVATLFVVEANKRGSAMHAEEIVARILAPCLVGLHAKRVAALKRAVVALLGGGVEEATSG